MSILLIQNFASLANETNMRIEQKIHHCKLTSWQPISTNELILESMSPQWDWYQWAWNWNLPGNWNPYFNSFTATLLLALTLLSGAAGAHDTFYNWRQNMRAVKKIFRKRVFRSYESDSPLLLYDWINYRRQSSRPSPRERWCLACYPWSIT